MKKIKLLVVAVLLFSMVSIVNTNNVQAANNITINVNNVKQSYSNKAIIKSGSTLVPLRGIFESLWATVQWNASTKTIDAAKGSNKIWLKIGSTTTKVNGKTVNISVPAQVVNGSTLVPLRFIGEALGATVNWEGKSKTVSIYSTITSTSSTSKSLKVHFLNVGQGDATFIQAPNGKTMLVDASTADYGDKIIDYLKAQNVKKIDYLVATHPDADHIGGMRAVINAFEIGEYFDSGKVHTSTTYERLLETVFNKNIRYTEPKVGDTIALDSSMKVQVLSVDANNENNNDASIVLKLSYNGISFLLTADAGATIEKQMMQKYDVSATILKAGHHGSSTSSSLAFLQKVKPEAIILSYGAGNSYGHPHKEVMANITAVGAKSYATATAGNIVVTTNGVTYSVQGKGIITTPATPEKPATTNPLTGDVNSGTYVIPGAPTTFKNCDEMRKYYPKGVSSTHPAYALARDGDKDGWACEK